MSSYVYCISNSKNGLKYIGSTTENLGKRMVRHRSKCKAFPNRKLYKAMREIGADNWKIELLQELEVSNKEALFRAEAFFIMAYNSIADGLNMKMPVSLKKIKQLTQHNK